MPLTRSNLRNSKNSESHDITEMLNEIKREPYVDLTINNKLLQNNPTTTKRKSSSPTKKKKTERSDKLSKSVTETQDKKRTSKSRSPSRRRKGSTVNVQRTLKVTKKVFTKVSKFYLVF